MEIPELIKLQQQYRDQMQIIGVSEDDEADQVHDFVQKVGINYPVVMAGADLIAAYGGVAALPTTFVVDTEGRVVQRHLGILDSETAEREIRSLAGLPVDARVEHFEDTGQIFSKNVNRATELPDVDFTGLSPDQKKQALRTMNTEGCTCGCKQMLAQCRMDDSTCDTSKERAAAIVKETKEGAANRPASATATATP
jgi:hypothetical protein